jgi:hypothetical protein
VLEKARVLLERYFILLTKRGTTQRTRHLVGEMRARLRDAQYLYDRILELEPAIARLWLRADPGANLRTSILSKAINIELRGSLHPDSVTVLPGFSSDDEIRLLLESFYHSAARVADILRDSKQAFPGIGRLEAKGIREVRNHLVQHPTRHRGVPVYSMAVGGPIGPQLKPVRYSEDPEGTLDQGLLANAAEFELTLEHALELGITALNGRGDR